MYCEYCGKGIADDSLYCQYCGGKQDVGMSIVNDSKEKNVPSIDKRLSTFFTRETKKYCILYSIWVLINIICWMFGTGFRYSDYNPHSYFYPFVSDRFWGKDIFFYDGTEFFVYDFLIPLVIVFYIKYLYGPLRLRIKEWNENRKKGH